MGFIVGQLGEELAVSLWEFQHANICVLFWASFPNSCFHETVLKWTDHGQEEKEDVDFHVISCFLGLVQLPV